MSKDDSVSGVVGGMRNWGESGKLRLPNTQPEISDKIPTNGCKFFIEKTVMFKSLILSTIFTRNGDF